MRHHTPFQSLVATSTLLLAGCLGGRNDETCPDAGSADAGPPVVLSTAVCPTDAAQRCEQWYGLDHSGVVCFDGEGEAPPEDLGCLRANAGALPAVYCCPPPPHTDDDGGAFGYPPCAVQACESMPQAKAQCSAFSANSPTPHCVATSLPGQPDSATDALHCVADPSWGQCGAYSPGLLCCVH